MKHLGKLAVLGAVLIASASFASADTITVGSYGTGASNLGNANTALNFAGSTAQPSGPYLANPSGQLALNTGTASTFDITPNGVWSAPVSGSSWVSQNFGTQPNGPVTAPNGYYVYNTTFTALGGNYNGTLNVMADDTVAVYLNGNLTPIILAGAIGGDGKCADNQPNCTTLDTVNFSTTLLAGPNANTLTFVVEQTGLSAEGVDFGGSFVTALPTPEPNSLVLLGTGLLGAAGMLVRKRRMV
jgi:hypothetical protein